jgi:hypothetical protein
MKAIFAIAGAAAALAAVPAAASACSCATAHHTAHRTVHYAKPVHRAHYARVAHRTHYSRVAVRTVYVTRVVHEPYPVEAYGPPPPPPMEPGYVAYGRPWPHHHFHARYGYYPRPDVVWDHPRDGWRADVNRY